MRQARKCCICLEDDHERPSPLVVLHGNEHEHEHLAWYECTSTMIGGGDSRCPICRWPLGAVDAMVVVKATSIDTQAGRTGRRTCFGAARKEDLKKELLRAQQARKQIESAAAEARRRRVQVFSALTLRLSLHHPSGGLANDSKKQKNGGAARGVG
jgi:hypothetical protein